MKAWFTQRRAGGALIGFAAGVVGLVCLAVRGETPSTAPPEGLRENTPAVHALVNARLVLSPGRTVERGTVVVRDGVIVAVGSSDDVTPPADARVWDLAGKTVYPGLIDAYSEAGDAQPGGGGGPAGGGGRPGATPGGGQELLQPVSGGATYWNRRVAPQARADESYRPDADTNRRLRSQGVVARLVAPSRNVIKGTSAAVSTGDGDGTRAVLRPVVAMHVQLTPSSGGGDRGYPVSPMGAVALVRQALYDAQWYARARAAWEADTSLPKPELNESLAALQPVVSGAMAVVIDAGDEQYVLRADRVAREFKLNAVIRGSGQEYRRVEEIAATGRAVIVPLNFGRAPNVASPEAAMGYSLEELLDWDLQPENPARLERAGVRIALTGHGLRDRGTFLTAVRKAVARGLGNDAALRALTVTPAELLGLSRSHGTIEVGKSASLLVTDGDLFGERTKVIETWVDGTRYEVTPQPKEDARGTWKVVLGEGGKSVNVRLTGEPTRLRGRITTESPATRPAMQEAAEDSSLWAWWSDTPPAGRSVRGSGGGRGSGGRGSGGESGVELANVSLTASQINFTFKGDSVGMAGVVQVSAGVTGDGWLGTGVRPDGSTFAVTATRTAKYTPADEERDAAIARRRGAGGRTRGGDAASPDGEGETETAPEVVVTGPTTRPAAPVEPVASAPQRREPPPGEREQPTTQVTTPPEVAAGTPGPATQPAAPALARAAERAATKPALYDVNYPLGAFGRTRQPDQPAAVLFKDATVWTSGPRGKLAKASVLVEHGVITGVFAEGEAVKELPAGAVVIDCAGRHVAPGIIDCHSHIATDGGVNEGSQSVTCEVRIGDFIDATDVNLYRQLAGGVTAANILHGSANTIGGQNQVIKFRWGADAEGLKFKEAPPGVKFALGENVKRSNSTTASGRYPASRMGVEQLVRDSFNAARDYRRAWDHYHATGKGVPPRVDLELEALWEIVSGRRMIHCHSYRQDEILAFLRVCESFGVRVGVFQHVLEGYKVADAMAKHGAGGSSFSDWWAYKYEAWDAIPYNGAVMHDAGVLVSFNSDDAELARRLNLEATKAVKYGGVPEEEALKFVTLNPAKQLGVDRYVGSIEVGKQADLVVWSQSPLSTYTRCEQTWVDGRRYFDREEDARMRTKAAEMRAALVQKILTGGEGMSDGPEGEPRPRDVWRHADDCACECGVILGR